MVFCLSGTPFHTPHTEAAYNPAGAPAPFRYSPGYVRLGYFFGRDNWATVFISMHLI